MRSSERDTVFVGSFVCDYFRDGDFSDGINFNLISDVIRNIKSINRDHQKKVYKILFDLLLKNPSKVSSSSLTTLKMNLRNPLRDYLEAADLATLETISNSSNNVLASLVAFRTDGKTGKVSGTQEFIQERIKEMRKEAKPTNFFSRTLSRFISASKPAEKTENSDEVLQNFLDELSKFSATKNIESFLLYFNAKFKQIADTLKNLKEDDFQIFLKDLLDKRAARYFSDTTGLYWLMNALAHAAEKNNTAAAEKISAIIGQLIAACKTDDQIKQLLQGLSEKITSGNASRVTGLYWLMNALAHAAEKNNTAAAETISATIAQLIAGCKTDDEIEKLLQGLSEKITFGNNPGETGLYRLMTVLATAAEKNNTAVAEKISATLTQLIAGCKTDDEIEKLLQGLSEKITSGNNSGETGLYRLMAALSTAAEKNNTAAVQKILAIIAQLITACKTDDQIQQLLQGLSEKRTSGVNIGTTGLYWLMDSLSWAAEKNNTAAAEKISSIISQLIAACKKPEQITQLLQGLSEKRTSGNNPGTTGLYWLMNALANAAEKNPAAAEKISEIIAQLITACKTPEQITLLLQGLSEKRTFGNAIGTTGFYWLMAALAYVDEKAAEKISAIITQLIAACKTDDQIQQLLLGLCEKRTSGNAIGTTGLYRLMGAFYFAAEKNPAAAEKISEIITQLITACKTPEQITLLLQGLSEQRTSGNASGTTGLYWLMTALSFAAEKNNTAAAEKISATLTQLIATCKTGDKIKQLLQGLSEKITSENPSGETGLYRLMAALVNAAEKNNTAAAEKISAIIAQLIQACSTPEQITLLLQGLSEKRMNGGFSGATGLYYLMIALADAAENYNIAALEKISAIIVQLITACKTDDQIKQLLQGLSEKRMNGGFSGATGLYFLMAALSDAATQKNIAAAGKISAIISQLISACETPEQITSLLQGLSEKRTSGNSSGRTGFHELMGALSWAAENNTVVAEKISATITQLIVACTTPAQITQLLKGLSEKIISGSNVGVTGLFWLRNALALAAAKNTVMAEKILETINKLIIAYFSKSDFSNAICFNELIINIASMEGDYKKASCKKLFETLAENKLVIPPELMLILKDKLRNPLRDYLRTVDLETLLRISNDQSALAFLVAFRTDGKTDKKSGTQEFIQERIKDLIKAVNPEISFSKLLKKVDAQLKSPGKEEAFFKKVKAWLENLSDYSLLPLIQEQLRDVFESDLKDEITTLVAAAVKIYPNELGVIIQGIPLGVSSSDDLEEHNVSFTPDEVVAGTVIGYNPALAVPVAPSLPIEPAPAIPLPSPSPKEEDGARDEQLFLVPAEEPCSDQAAVCAPPRKVTVEYDERTVPASITHVGLFQPAQAAPPSFDLDGACRAYLAERSAQQLDAAVQVPSGALPVRHSNDEEEVSEQQRLSA